MPPEKEADELVALESNDRYLISQDDEGYAVRRVDGQKAQLIARFPDSEEGAALASAEYRRLTREWRINERLPRALMILAVISAATWLVVGAIDALLFATGLLFNGSGRANLIGWLQVIDTLAFRTGIAAVAVLGSWAAVRFLRSTSPRGYAT